MRKAWDSKIRVFKFLEASYRQWKTWCFLSMILTIWNLTFEGIKEHVRYPPLLWKEWPLAHTPIRLPGGRSILTHTRIFCFFMRSWSVLLSSLTYVSRFKSAVLLGKQFKQVGQPAQMHLDRQILSLEQKYTLALKCSWDLGPEEKKLNMLQMIFQKTCNTLFYLSFSMFLKHVSISASIYR